MSELARSPGFRADFREVRNVSLLREPIQSHGTLYFAPPDRFARYTRGPARSIMIIDGTQVQVRDEFGDEQLDLSAHLGARRLVDLTLLLFRGDLAELRRRCDVKFSQENDKWELRLAPRGATVKQVMRAITLRGKGRVLGEMIVLDGSGDRTTTTFSNPDPNYRFDEAELDSVFRSSSR